MIRLFKYIILFSLLLNINLLAQVCNFCNKKITSNYITVDGLDFHPNHFICNSCGKSIEGSFTKDDKKYFHTKCYEDHYGLLCDYCKKIIKGQFIDSEEGKFHKTCFNNHVVEKCAVCSKPLVGHYIVDVHNMKYHKEHKNDLPTCSNCNRLISSITTNGGVELEDKRSLCTSCFQSRIKSKNEYETLLSKTIYNLSLLGLKFNSSTILVEPVNKRRLAEVSQNSVNSNTKGFCQSSYKYREKNGIREKFDEVHKIYILDRLPEQSTESILAHELMHVWMHQNDINNLPSNIVEGSCNFISYLYMKDRFDNPSKEVLLLLENDRDKIYGDGFREIKRRFGSKTLNDLLRFLMNY